MVLQLSEVIDFIEGECLCKITPLESMVLQYESRRLHSVVVDVQNAELVDSILVNGLQNAEVTDFIQ